MNKGKDKVHRIL